MHDEKCRKFSNGSTIVLNGKKSTAKTFTERFFGLNYGRIPQT